MNEFELNKEKIFKIIPIGYFSRSSVKKDENYMYLFTDNLERTSGKNPIKEYSWYREKYGHNFYPGMTQAVIRGLENAYPITTMLNDKRKQWEDSMLESYKVVIDGEIQQIKDNMYHYNGIKYSGEMPFGKGSISDMPEKIWNYLNKKLEEIGIINY